MKKTKLVAALAVVFTASVLLTGCPEPDPEAIPGKSDVVETPDTPDTPDVPDTPDTPEDPDTPDTPDNPDTPEDAFFLDNYAYKMNFVGAGIESSVDTWGSGAGYGVTENGEYSLGSANMWGGTEGVVLAFTGIKKGTIAKYDYIAFTADFSAFTLDESDAPNAKVNIKVPEEQRVVSLKNENKDGTVTYYIPVSEFGTAPASAVQFAIIIGGSGTVKLTKVYLAAEKEPAEDPEVAPAVTKNEVLFAQDEAIVTNALKEGLEGWWDNGTYCTYEADTVDGYSVKKCASGVAGGCFGIYLTTPAAYKAGAKLQVTVKSSANFKVKPVAPDKELEIAVTPDEWTTVAVSLGDEEGELQKVGIIVSAADQVIYISDMRIIDNE